MALFRSKHVPEYSRPVNALRNQDVALAAVPQHDATADSQERLALLDQHLGIGKGKIDYNWFSETLNKIGYDKSVIIESITDVPQSIQKLQQLLA